MGKIFSYYRIFQISIFLLLCWGAHAWFTWDWDYLNKFEKIGFVGVFSFIAYIYQKKYDVNIKFDGKTVLITLAFIAAHFFPVFGLTLPVVNFLLVYPILVLINDIDHVEDHLRFITTALGYILVPGMIIWTIVLATNIPALPIQHPNESTNYLFYNYYFALKQVFSYSDFPRFFSVFLEPGYLGTLLSFLLYANRFDLSKKRNIILVIALLFSLSLAGYLTTIIGYVLFLLQEGKKIGKTVFALLFIFGALWTSTIYNNGENAINKMIVARLQIDDTKGISGNNRNSKITDDYFEQIVTSGDILWGDRNSDDIKGQEESQKISGAGYKVFFIRSGLMSFMLYLLFYVGILIKLGVGNYGRYFLTLIVLTFLQAAYLDSFSWMIPYVLGTVYHKKLCSIP